MFLQESKIYFLVLINIVPCKGLYIFVHAFSDDLTYVMSLFKYYRVLLPEDYIYLFGHFPAKITLFENAELNDINLPFLIIGVLRTPSLTTAQIMKYSIPILQMRILSHLLEKSFMGNFICVQCNLFGEIICIFRWLILYFDAS